MLRFDKAEIKGVRFDQNGYLIADAALTRSGVFVYRGPNGEITRELRHPDDVFKKDSLESLKNRPFTDGHPVVGRIDAKNSKQFTKGILVEGPEVEADRLVIGKIQVMDADVIEKMTRQDSPVREISCGYSADVIAEEGVYNGEKYDHRQTNIIYNHVALVSAGRAGHEVRMRLDADDAVADDNYFSTTTHEPKEDTVMYKQHLGSVKTQSFKADAVDIVIGVDDKNLPEVEKVIATLSGRFDSAVEVIRELEEKVGALKTEKDTIQGKLDSANEDLGKAKDIKPEELQKMVSERLDAMAAAAHVGLEKIDEMSTGEIKKAVVAKKHPDLVLDEASEGYIEGRFEAILDGVDRSAEAFKSLAKLRDITTAGVKQKTKTDGESNHEGEDENLSPRDRFIKDTRDMHKQPAA